MDALDRFYACGSRQEWPYGCSAAGWRQSVSRYNGDTGHNQPGPTPDARPAATHLGSECRAVDRLGVVRGRLRVDRKLCCGNLALAERLLSAPQEEA